MGISDVNARLSFLFFGEDSKRVRVKYGPNGLIYIFFDPHGMNVTVFRRYLNNLIAAIRIPFLLIITHGFHHGTALRSVVWDYSGIRLTSRQLAKGNPGCTYMTFSVHPALA